MVSIDDAHAALLRNKTLQFDAKAEPIRLATSHWSMPFGSETIVWVLVGLAVLAIVVLAVSVMRRRRKSPVARPQDLAQDAAIPLAVVQLALSDADALAARGHFLEAAHMLLACGVDEIARRFPNSLRATTTSRDIAEMASLPTPMRTAFGRIAAAVEIGLFGGRPLSEDHYAECRAVFVTSALAGRT